MNRNHPPAAWNRFLEAEEAGRDDAAEQALGELLRALPERRPRPGFASRVMARVAVRQERGWAWLARPAARAAVAAAAVAAALASALLLPLVGPLARLIGPGGAVELLTGAIAGLASRFAAGLAAWAPVATATRALGLALLDPDMIALLAVQLLVATLALRGLVRIASAQRSSVHVAH
jgi:hypothetical protein